MLSDRVLAFLKVAELGSFSKAAKALSITQPSLSKRIQLLEQEIESKLFTRMTSGIELTSEGRKLFSFVSQTHALEKELLLTQSVKDESELSGYVKIIGSSSHMNSMIIPCLSKLLSKNIQVQIEFSIVETALMPQSLLSRNADFVLMDQVYEKKGVVAELLGYDRFVVIYKSGAFHRSDTFLDTHPLDNTSENFLRQQGTRMPKDFKRCFMHNIYGVIAGAQNGLGYGVVEERLVPKDGSVKIENKFKATKYPLALHYLEQPFYTQLQIAVRKELLNIRDFFKVKSHMGGVGIK